MQDLSALLNILPLEEYDAGHDIVVQGTPSKYLHFLESGRVEIFKDDVKITEVCDKGAVFGEMSVLLESPHTATVRTKEPSSFRVVEVTGEFLVEQPRLALYVAEILARRLDSLNRYLVDVKTQFKDFDDHVCMVDEVLDVLMTKHPRKIERRPLGETDM